MNGLMLGHDARSITRQELALIPTPASTPTWKPVPHVQVAELAINESQRRGWNVVSEEYGLATSQHKMFGVLRFSPMGRTDITRALGVRNSHDKSIAVGLAAGLNVFVCSNLCMASEIVVHRRHTSGMELESLVGGVFDRLELSFVKLERNADSLHLQAITIDDARRIIVVAAEAKAIPSQDILAVLNEFRKPKHEEFQDRTRWSLLNAFTEIAKKYSPPRFDLCQRKLSNIFQLDA